MFRHALVALAALACAAGCSNPPQLAPPRDAGSPTCSAGESACNGSCVTLKDDPRNRGACTTTQSCVASECYENDCPDVDCSSLQVCAAGRSCVGGRCVRLRCALDSTRRPHPLQTSIPGTDYVGIWDF